MTFSVLYAPWYMVLDNNAVLSLITEGENRHFCQQKKTEKLVGEKR